MKTTKRIKKFAQLLMAFFCWLTFFVGVLVFANWPEPPKDAIFGGWLWEVFNLNESGTGKLVLNAKQVVLPDDADKIENPAQLATKQYVDDHAGGSLGGAKKLIQDFVVAEGESVTAGDVVAYADGKLTRFSDKPDFGEENVFNAGGNYGYSMAVLDSTHFLITYGNFDGIRFTTKVAVGTILDNTISYGTESVFDFVNFPIITVLDSTHFVVAYNKSNYLGKFNGMAIVGTISGNEISYGEKYVFNSADSKYISMITLDSNRFVIIYRDDGDNKRNMAIVGTVSGDEISYGAEYYYSRTTSNIYHSITALDTNHFVIAFVDSSIGYGTAVVGTVSGNEIVYGSPVAFNSVSTHYPSVVTLDSTHFVIAYSGWSKIGTVSHNDRISYGPQCHGPSLSSSNSVVALDSQRFMIVSSERVMVGRVSDNEISYGMSYLFNDGEHTYSPFIIALDSTNFAVAYWDRGNNDFGTVLAGKIGWNNSVGIAQEDKWSGEDCAVATAGISDIHTDLVPWTVYYADDLGLTTSKTNYQIGLAISSTELLLDPDSTSEDQYFGDMIFANNFRITEDWESPQGLIFKNQLSRDVLHLDENGALTAEKVLGTEVKGTKLQVWDANQENCDESNYGAIKFENNNFYGCKSGSGWVQFTN